MGVCFLTSSRPADSWGSNFSTTSSLDWTVVTATRAASTVSCTTDGIRTRRGASSPVGSAPLPVGRIPTTIKRLHHVQQLFRSTRFDDNGVNAKRTIFRQIPCAQNGTMDDNSTVILNLSEPSYQRQAVH